MNTKDNNHCVYPLSLIFFIEITYIFFFFLTVSYIADSGNFDKPLLAFISTKTSELMVATLAVAPGTPPLLLAALLLSR